MARKKQALKHSLTQEESAHADLAIRTLVRAAAAHAAVARRNASTSTSTTSATSPDSSIIVESIRHGKAPSSYKSPPALEDPYSTCGSTNPTIHKNLIPNPTQIMKTTISRIRHNAMSLLFMCIFWKLFSITFFSWTSVENLELTIQASAVKTSFEASTATTKAQVKVKKYHFPIKG